MTDPGLAGAERGTRAPAPAAGAQGAVGAVLIVLALGLALRLIIAYLLPGSGFEVDLSSFRYWANNLATEGLYGFYERDFFHDYTPGYLYVLWLVGLVGQAVGGIGDLIKVPPALADLAIGWLVWSMVRELGGRDRLALLAALVAVLNPISWFDSVVWGQVDSFGVVFLLLALRALWRDRPERAAIFTVIAALIKPQLGILVPLVAVVTIRRALWPSQRREGAAGPTPAPYTGILDRLRAWERRTGHWWRILTTGLAGYLTAVALSAPFGLSVVELSTSAPFFSSGLIDQIVVAGGGYPYLTVNAYNAWAIVPGDLGNSLANAGLWVCDVVTPDASQCGAGTAVFGAVPAVVVGATLLIVAIVLVLAVAARRPDRLALLVGLAVLALAFFAVPTRVHERYGFPFFAVGAILFAISPRWRIAYVVLSIATFANMYVVLTTLYPPEDQTLNPIRDWLGIGEFLRSQVGVTAAAAAHTAGFIWAFLQLRAGALERLATELRAAARAGPVDEVPAGLDEAIAKRLRGLRGEPEDAPGVEEALVGGSSATDDAGPGVASRPGVALALPTWSERRPFSEAGFVGWLRDRFADPPVRADRSRLLAAEGGGRFDRLDVFLLVVLLLGALGMRMFRLAEPLQMHFDEVYHARTATEFLQSWRYGEDHDIYEWTHPHLAKYAMAAGLVLWGEDRVSAESRLGVPVRAAAHEPRRDDGAAGGRSGERAHVATGDEIRTYDLHSRELVSRFAAAGAGALAVDPVSEQLVIGFDDGTIAATDLLAIGIDGVDSDLESIPLATVDHPVERLFVTDDGSIVAASTDRLTIVGADGAAVGTIDLPGIADIGPGGSGDALERIAVATADGVEFIDPATIDIVASIPLDGGAHGLAEVTGIDDPKLYVTSGAFDDPSYTVIAIGGDDAADGPTLQGTHPLPGPGTRVAYDDATQMVHVLGLVPGASGTAGGDPSTVYVIEPHANAVFADAALPPTMDPAAWVLDVEAQYPSADREQLLVFGADGATASIELGSHAFAWRLPGVLAGALMGLCLYVLARILFRRRLVAGLVAAFVLLDGMLFVQSRIGMNDAYVALFIVAAYTLFAAVWTGWWRSRFAPWLAFPAIGVLLGLALASKWVAAYAIGALALLLLARSALGRVVAIAGLIGITTVLGYMGINVPEGQGLGNLTFLLIMIGLTLVAVVTAIAHPIAWTDTETRFAIVAPAAAGVAVFFGALALGRLSDEYVLGPVVLAPIQVALALALSSLAVFGLFAWFGRLGYGPLAVPPDPGDPRRLLEPPADPPPGWLRPGWLAGIPLAYAAVCLVAIPLAVYVISYVPWALLDGHQLWAGVPAGHTGQTLLELTRQMYDYHNGLTSPHAASSPWWAWPFDLKPVWFYQESFAGNTSAAIYGAGNLVLWWMGAAAMVFVSIMAYRRRSLALALIAVGFAAQWIPWARIDRAAFQYHYYTALPFVVLGLAYFGAELWHGASRRTWLAARIAAAVAIVAPAALWLFSRPLCWFVGVESVNPGSQACPAVIPDMVITARSLGLLGVVVVGTVVLGRAVLALGREGVAAAETDRAGASPASPGLTVVYPVGSDEAAAADATPSAGGLRLLLLPAVAVAVGFALAALLPETEIVHLSGIPVEPIAFIVGLPLAWFAAQVIASRDAHRYLTGLVIAIGAWFAVVYPNISALPLPSAVVNAYQGILPTYLYAFQFQVSTADRTVTTPLLSPALFVLAVAITATCAVVAYSASVWRLALAESAAARTGSSAGGGTSPTAGASPSLSGD